MRTHTSPRLRLRGASWIALARAALALGVGAQSASAVALSPELQALEAKSKELKITSERYTIDELIKDANGKTVSFTATGRERASPQRAEFKETIKGKQIAVRVVGKAVYVEYPGLGRLDHGRPWVRSSESQVSAESEVNLESGANRFSATYALLGSEAESVERVGTTSVAGQETTQFTATVAVDRLTSLLSSKLLAALEKAGATTARLAIFIAPDGEPLQSVLDISVEGGTITVSTSVVQVNEPVSVFAPPAARTISEAGFKALEKRLKG